MRLRSSSFEAGGAIPTIFSCEGKDVSPELDWSNAPKETKSFALIVHDPDAPLSNGFTHWLIYNIPPDVRRMEADQSRNPRIEGLGVQGENSAGKIGYMGPCPPSGTHRYYFRLYALRTQLPLDPGAKREELEEAMYGHVIEEAELMGTYGKAQAKAAR